MRVVDNLGSGGPRRIAGKPFLLGFWLIPQYAGAARVRCQARAAFCLEIANMSKSTFWQRFGSQITQRDGWHCTYCDCIVLERNETFVHIEAMLEDTHNGHITWNEYAQERDGLLKRIATIDHVIPRSKNGTDTLKNLVVACHSCNSSKGTN